VLTSQENVLPPAPAVTPPPMGTLDLELATTDKSAALPPAPVVTPCNPQQGGGLLERPSMSGDAQCSDDMQHMPGPPGGIPVQHSMSDGVCEHRLDSVGAHSCACRDDKGTGSAVSGVWYILCAFVYIVTTTVVFPT